MLTHLVTIDLFYGSHSRPLYYIDLVGGSRAESRISVQSSNYNRVFVSYVGFRSSDNVTARPALHAYGAVHECTLSRNVALLLAWSGLSTWPFETGSWRQSGRKGAYGGRASDQVY